MQKCSKIYKFKYKNSKKIEKKKLLIYNGI
jgi:hypothetical protein